MLVLKSFFCENVDLHNMFDQFGDMIWLTSRHRCCVLLSVSALRIRIREFLKIIFIYPPVSQFNSQLK